MVNQKEVMDDIERMGEAFFNEFFDHLTEGQEISLKYVWMTAWMNSAIIVHNAHVDVFHSIKETKEAIKNATKH